MANILFSYKVQKLIHDVDSNAHENFMFFKTFFLTLAVHVLHSLQPLTFSFSTDKWYLPIAMHAFKRKANDAYE